MIKVSTIQVERCKQELGAFAGVATAAIEDWVYSIISAKVLDAGERMALRTWANDECKKIDSATTTLTPRGINANNRRRPMLEEVIKLLPAIEEKISPQHQR
jgi:hypothetical protein